MFDINILWFRFILSLIFPDNNITEIFLLYFNDKESI